MTVVISSGGLNPSNNKRRAFPNLAGHPGADQQVKKELEAAGVSLVQHANLVERSEVPTHFTGLLVTPLDQFVFERCWYYWRVEGLVPLAVAEKMYATAVGKQDVRCAGDCGCPPPKQVAVRFLNGKEVWPTKEKVKFSQLGLKVELDNYVFSDDSKVGKLYVPHYDIDTQEGLNLFVRTVKAV